MLSSESYSIFFLFYSLDTRGLARFEQLLDRMKKTYSGRFSHHVLFSIGTKRSFGYCFPKSKPKTFNIVLKVWYDDIVAHINWLLT